MYIAYNNIEPARGGRQSCRLALSGHALAASVLVFCNRVTWTFFLPREDDGKMTQFYTSELEAQAYRVAVLPMSCARLCLKHICASRAATPNQKKVVETHIQIRSKMMSSHTMQKPVTNIRHQQVCYHCPHLHPFYAGCAQTPFNFGLLMPYISPDCFKLVQKNAGQTESNAVLIGIRSGKKYPTVSESRTI